jgi:hypothetical protein
VPRYRFVVNGDTHPTELVAESFSYDNDAAVFRNVTEEKGREVDVAYLRARLDSPVETITD